MILSFVEMVTSRRCTYADWALSLSRVLGTTISKQAVFYRLNSAFILTLEKLVITVIGQQTSKGIKHKVFDGFKNVLIQDSTCVHLPQVMIEKFKGSVVNGKQNSVAKLNVIVNALSGLCPRMEWTSYTVTEQSLSLSIMTVANVGDLVIRDLGYFVLSVFKKMDEGGIFFLSKWKYGVVVFDIKTKKRIDLLKKLKGKKHLDIKVLCGASEELEVRMVAYKLSDAQTAEKIRKAKQDRNKRTNHKADFYFLLGYVIFITNVENDTWSWQEVTEAYRVRWNVEILFKSWKSGLDIKKMIPDAKLHTDGVESILYLMMLYIAWFQLLVYAPLYWFCYERGIYLSIMKVAKWMADNIMRCINNPITSAIKKEITYYCCYETRLRTNASQHLDLFLEDLA